jgi:hypothetical protein
MAVGNWLSLGHLVDKRHYKDNLPPEDLEEQRIARMNYGIFRKFFHRHYSVVVREKIISPFSLFRRSLVQFSSALVLYKWKAAPTAPEVPGCPPAVFQMELEAMLQEQYPELMPSYKRTFGKTSHFHWTGPDFTIRPRLPADADQEVQDFDDFVIFEDPEDTESEEEEDELPEESPVVKGKKRQNNSKSYASNNLPFVNIYFC